LQCDRCCDDSSWKCNDCLGLSVEMYEMLLSNAGRELKWFCTPCSKEVMSQRDSVTEKLDDIGRKLENLVDRMHSIEAQLDSKADLNAVVKLEVQVDNFEKRMSSIETAIQSATVSKKADEDLVKDYVEKVLESKHLCDDEEKAEKDKRKTSVIIHGVKESDCDQSSEREEEDLAVLATMLHELGCDEVKVTKVIRLGKRMTDASSEVKPRPIKMVVETEEQKVKIIRSAKKLEITTGGRLEKCLNTSGLNIEGTGEEEETTIGNENEERKQGNWAHIDWQQDCETIDTGTTTNGVAGSAHVLRCLYTNANSVINKMDELRERVLVNDIDVIAITETWSREEIADSELCIDGYVLYRKDRQSEKHCKGGDVVILVKTS